MIARLATSQDTDALCTLLNEIIKIGGTTAYEKELTEPEFSAKFVIGSHCLSCYVCEVAESRVVGFQSLFKNEKLGPGWGDIATFAQAEPKTKGVGTVLFGATCEFARAHAIKMINATIRADNTPGLSYYSKLGFVDYHVDQAVPLQDGTPVDRIYKRFQIS